MGIQHSILLLQGQRERDVLFKDFENVETLDFPRRGTDGSSKHQLSDFKFRVFAPVAFRCFRNLFNLDVRNFLNSICNQGLRELSNPGASGSIFYISADDDFIIKTVQHKEANFLQKLLPEYYINLVQHPRTLLPKFYGLYCYQSLGKNIRFVVMNNLLPSSIKMHERYDLKGSSYKRKASEREMAKNSPTLKDLDFKERHPKGIALEADTYDALMKTIERDCRVLESFNIMDYSFLLGIHNFDQSERARVAKRKAKSGNGVLRDDLGHPLNPSSSDDELDRPLFPAGPSGELYQQQPKSDSASAAAPNNRTSPFLRNAFRVKSGKRLTAYSTAMESIEAKAEPVNLEPNEGNTDFLGGLPARSNSGDRLFLYVGIIDILQSYRVAKKMEHTLKSVVIDGATVSVTNPAFYAKRFQQTLANEVFRRTISLDQPQVMGPYAHRFRNVAHLATAAVAMKQSYARRRALNSKPPLPQRHLNDISSGVGTNQQNAGLTSVTTWPRHGFYALPHVSNSVAQCSSECGRESDHSSLQLLSHVSAPPLPYSVHGRRYYDYSPYRSRSTLFYGNGDSELSWCAQSILSLALTEEDDADSSESTNSDVYDSILPKRSVVEVQELNSELLAVQKLLRRQGAKNRRNFTLNGHKSLAVSNPNLSQLRDSLQEKTLRSMTPESIPSPRIPVMDRRLRQQASASPKTFVIKPLRPTNDIEGFMQEAESDFDKGIHFSLFDSEESVSNGKTTTQF